MAESIYENSGFSADRKWSGLKDGANSHKGIYLNEGARKSRVTRKTQTVNAEPSHSGLGCYKLAVVFLVILVVLLLVAIATLWFKWITERDEMQTRYKNLGAEKDNGAEERDQLQNKTDEFQNIFIQLKKGWGYFNGSIYYISTEKKNWSEGRQDCRGRGAELVIINSKEEENYVHVWRKGKHAWVGANDAGNEGVWKWVDGTAMNMKAWCKGEPDNLGDEDCLMLDTCWHDVPCGHQYVWICEKRLNISNE